MVIKNLLNKMGIEENVVDVLYVSGERKPFLEMDLNEENTIEIDVNIDKGCDIRFTNCQSGGIVQRIDVIPYIETLYRSVEPSKYKYVTIFLNKRFDKDDIDKKTHKLQMGKICCMQCKKAFYNNELFWINDYQGITYKKVCSTECEKQAIKELDEAKKSWGFDEYDVVDF